MLIISTAGTNAFYLVREDFLKDIDPADRSKWFIPSEPKKIKDVKPDTFDGFENLKF